MTKSSFLLLSKIILQDFIYPNGKTEYGKSVRPVTVDPKLKICCIKNKVTYNFDSIFSSYLYSICADSNRHS